MRILVMADTPPDPSSGSAGTEFRTIAALRRLGHEVDDIWSARLGRRIRHGNLHYLLELPRAYRREMKRAAASKTYDVIHVNQPHGFLAAKSRPAGALFVHRSHGLELRAERDLAPWHERYGTKPRFISRLMAALLARHSRLIARYADGHIVSCSEDAEYLTSRLTVAPERVAVIPQAAPEAFFQHAPRAMTPERLRRILYVSQFAFFKAPMIAGQAMRTLAAKHDLDFTWVCSRAHHENVRSMAPANIELLDWMPADNLIDVYDAHGIFLFPSFWEGFGKVFLEAMSRGLCVIATRVGGARDVIESGSSGVLVPAGDSAAMVSAVEQLLRDPDRAGAMSATAARVARAYSWDRVGRETAAFYERLQRMRT